MEPKTKSVGFIAPPGIVTVAIAVLALIVLYAIFSQYERHVEAHWGSDGGEVKMDGSPTSPSD